VNGSHLERGDSHNFGRRVSSRDGWIVKPRTVTWERLLLSRKSPLRRLLEQLAKRDGLGRDAFGFLPDLAFSRARTLLSGEVESLELAPLPSLSNDERRALARITARCIALSSFLGLADLHWENMVLGVARDGQVVFSPIDAEMILADLSLPTETKLLPDADPEVAAICRHAAGVRRLLPYLGKPVDVEDLCAMASVYRATLGFLDRHAPEIADVFARLPRMRETPIRVCLRGTDEYVRARSQPVWPPLLDAEAEQLARGDIPYFFRLYGRPGIHFYADRALEQIKTLPLRGDVPRLEPLLPIARGLRAPSRKTLRDEGVFALLGAFDHPSFAGRHGGDGLEVRFGQRALVVRTPLGEELSAKRNLSAFVGSVYLPCRCGEVRSVFVPPTTRCEGDRADEAW
jgi:hypothetical protein